MASTLSDLVSRTLTRLSQVGGAGVQTYSEDIIAEMIQHKFDELFDRRFFDEYSAWYTWALDGTLGVVTTDLTDIVKRIQDVRVIFREGYNTPITKLSTSVNPFLYSGVIPKGYTGHPSANRALQFWPKSATGNVNVHARTKPEAFQPDDEIKMDDQVLILGAAYDYLEDDGSNPAATAKFQTMYEARRKQLLIDIDSGPLALDPFAPVAQTGDFTVV